MLCFWMMGILIFFLHHIRLFKQGCFNYMFNFFVPFEIEWIASIDC